MDAAYATYRVPAAEAMATVSGCDAARAIYREAKSAAKTNYLVAREEAVRGFNEVAGQSSAPAA